MGWPGGLAAFSARKVRMGEVFQEAREEGQELVGLQQGGLGLSSTASLSRGVTQTWLGERCWEAWAPTVGTTVGTPAFDGPHRVWHNGHPSL